jgi:hypothetical protein
MSLSKFVFTDDYSYSKGSLKRTREVKKAKKVNTTPKPELDYGEN